MDANIVLALLVATGGHEIPCVHLPADALRGALPTTGRAARLAPRVAEQARIAGELGLEGWLLGDVLVLGDTGEKEARALARQVAAVSAEVGRCWPERGALPDDAPLVLYHVHAWGRYRAVVDELAASYPDERDFLESMRDSAGFELSAPRLRAVGIDATARRGANLLVHLAAHALVDGEVEGVPGWLLEGLALEVETRVCGGPVAFCGSGACAAKAAPATWTRRLASELMCKDEAAWAATFALPAGRASEPATWRALGVVRWLLRRHADRFGEVVRAATIAEKAARQRSADDADRARLQAVALAGVVGERWRSELVRDVDFVVPGRPK